MYLFVRILRLNCLTKYYAKLWDDNYVEKFKNETWSNEDKRLSPFSIIEKQWDYKNALRNQFERRYAILEIDVISGQALGLSLDDL